MQAKIQSGKSKILIAGAGPAGTSAAIRLAQRGFSVTLIERERFPRQKLCGEFISPECFRHFAELGVASEMRAAGGEDITETVFYAPNGKSVSVPSEWFNLQSAALGLSRAEMDLRLLKRAEEAGVTIRQETQVIGLLHEGNRIAGIRAKTKTETHELTADLIIDATGRAGILRKIAEKESQPDGGKSSQSLLNRILPASRARLVGFKTHLANAAIEPGRCEIYFFRGGYGGLNLVENGAANHCFLIKAEIVREFGGDAEKIVSEVVFQNKRARAMMQVAEPLFDWLAVSIQGFGAQNLAPAPNLLAIGDAGAFIDPFTGSGMLMALESGKILAEIVANEDISIAQIAGRYRQRHAQAFRNRLRLCNILRRAAFAPNLARLAISILNVNSTPVEVLARATRS